MASIGVPGAEIAHVRRAEQQAAKLPDVSEVKFSGLGKESLLDDRRELHEDLVRVIRKVRPQPGGHIESGAELEEVRQLSP